MTRKLVGIIGSAIPSIGARGAVEHLCRAARARDPGLSTEILSLDQFRLPMVDGRKGADVPAVADVIARVSAATAVIVATPIYRGSFTGVLKNMLDWLPIECLQGKPVAMIGSGSTPHHYLAIDCALRPVLIWFGACVLSGSVYLTKGDVSADGVPNQATAGLLDALAAALVFSAAAPSVEGPPPLALQR